jgi:hypothetical protein
MSERQRIIPVWFFVGLLVLTYGILILASGIREWSDPPNVVLSNLHASVWWGGLLTIIGVVYVIAFRPGKSQRED